MSWNEVAFLDRATSCRMTEGDLGPDFRRDDGKSCDDGNGRDDGTKTVVMPLKNGTQKFLKLGPDFRRDDDEGKVRDDDDRWVAFALST